MESLDSGYWTDFALQVWEQRTTHLSWPIDLNPTLIFEVMLHAAELERRKEQTNFLDPYRIALDGCQLLDLETFSALLPCAADGQLEGYIQRLEALTDYDLGIQVCKVTRFSPHIWQSVRNFLHPLFAQLNVIPESIEVDVFFGKYAQTHFGVHRDADSTFTFGLMGEKEFRMWPLEFFKPEMAVEDWPTHIQEKYYHKYRNKAQCVKVTPGTLLYWPSSVWHVGESPETWSLTLAVALILKPDVYERVKTVIAQVLPDPMQVVDPQSYPCNVARRSCDAPPILDQALADIRATMNSQVVDMHLHLAWLKQASGLGLIATPPPQEGEFDLHKSIQIDPRHPILWKCFPQNQIVIAVNGFGDIFGLDVASDALVALLTQLNLGQPLRVSETLSNPSQAVSHVLQALYRWFAFPKTPNPKAHARQRGAGSAPDKS